jgi:hypothetical protein
MFLIPKLNRFIPSKVLISYFNFILLTVFTIMLILKKYCVLTFCRRFQLSIDDYTPLIP